MTKLNPQGLARRDPGFMRCLLPDHGMKTVSIDLSAGEPTVTSQFSKDPRYTYACLTGVGQKPYYDGRVLMISDLYLMTMSVSPMGAHFIRDHFDTFCHEGRTFAEQWLVDADVAKSKVKKLREIVKVLALAISYGMGPKKMVKQCYDRGYDLTLKDARAFYNEYWELFAGVRRFSDHLADRVRRDKYIVNPFGYRMTPEPHLGFNYFIQSTVSGIMHAFVAKIMAIASYARFRTVIHDELIADVPDDKVDLFKHHKDLATASLNEDLGWSVKIRTGFAVGNDWYEAK